MRKFFSYAISKKSANNKSTSPSPTSSNGRLPLTSYVQGAHNAVWTERSYSQFASEAYVKNVIANRAINMISTSAASVPFSLFTVKNGVKAKVENHEVLSLLNKPNAIISRANFLESIYAYRVLSGNVFIQGVNADYQTKTLPAELYNLRPDRVSVLAGSNIIPLGYRYKVSGFEKDFFADQITGACEILHIKTFNPINDWYGLSEIESVAYSIDQHNESAKWNMSLLQNGARPSGIITVKNPDYSSSIIGPEAFSQIKQDIYDSFGGAINAGKPVLLEGGMEWKEMGITPRDMDFIESKNSSAREIALGLGVPPHLLGIQGDNTYSNMSEARNAFWEQTVIPLTENVYDAVGSWLQHFTNDVIELRVDKDAVMSITDKQNALWKRIGDSSFLSDNEKREMLGLSSTR